jgi:pimeloyl-ACP methyl ester carboxylesterase
VRNLREDVVKIEILKALPATPSAEPPVLFLHGAFSGAWVWAEHVLDFMAERGHAAYALSFRGHGRSEGREDLARYGLADYADDVRTAIRYIGCPPVLVGHSMGGLVAQRCLGRERLAGLALMAPVPPEGVMAANAHTVLRDPWLLAEIARTAAVGSGQSAHASSDLRRMMVADDLPPALANTYLLRMQNESRRALAEVQVPSFCLSAACLGVPALVVGREGDHFISPAALRRTAWFHGAALHTLPGEAHALMLEAHWREPATLLAHWLARTVA